MQHNKVSYKNCIKNNFPYVPYKQIVLQIQKKILTFWRYFQNL